MKIAYLSVFYPFRGGIAQSNTNLYRELAKKAEVQAFNFSRQYPGLLFPGQTQYVPESDRTVNFPTQRTLDSINPLTWFSTARKIRALQPDALLVRFWMPFFAPALGAVACLVRRDGTKVIAILDNVIPHEQRLGDSVLTRFFLNQIDAGLVMTQEVRNDVRRFRADVPCRLKPLPLFDHFPDTVDKETARARLGLSRDRKVLLFFGFIRNYKGLDTLLKAVKYLSEDYLLVIAGEVYGSFNEYENLIDQLTIREKLQLNVKYIPEIEVQNYFKAADVCVLPYKSATQSGIVQIAFHFRTPVIVTNVGGLSEMVSDGETGLVLDSQDPVQLAGAIERFFREQLADDFSENIAARQDDYSWSGFADAVIGLIDSLNRNREKNEKR